MSDQKQSILNFHFIEQWRSGMRGWIQHPFGAGKNVVVTADKSFQLKPPILVLTETGKTAHGTNPRGNIIKVVNRMP